MPRRRLPPPFVLAMDVGSSSVKGALYDGRARMVEGSLVREAGSLDVTGDGAVADPEELARRTESVVDAVLDHARTLEASVAAVGFDTLAFTTCGVDRRGRPLTPLYTYADSRSRDDVAALARRIDLDAAYQRTGTPLHTAYLPGRLAWLRRTRPAVVRRVAGWRDVATFLYERWFESPVAVSYSVASWSGLMERRTLRWDAELLRLLRVDEGLLPPLADWTDARRGLAPLYARRWPALREAPFFLAVGDGAAANVGSGCVSSRRLALTVGTSGALRVVPDRAPRRVPAGLWAYRIGAKETLLGGAFNEGGNVLAWARSAFRLPPPERIDRELAALPPDGHGLTVLPFLEGERSPGWSSRAQAAITGITGSTTGAQLLQACLEAVSYRFAGVARLLRPYLHRSHEIVASGGAMSRSPYWVQLMADVLQRPVRLSREAELTSRGAAILALRGLGEWKSLQDVPLDPGERFEPDRARGAVYLAAIERQHRLYDTLLGHEAEIGQRLRAVRRRR